MKPLLFELNAAPGLTSSFAGQLSAEVGDMDRRQFPDGETYLRFQTPVQGREVILLCTLDRPDSKLAPLLFAAAAARDQGARRVGLVAPYLAYMRQDKQFQRGEAITSKAYAALISDHVDWLVTIDPHLHRYPTLDVIYAIPSIAATAANSIAEWIGRNVDRPVVIGPDEESAQWVNGIANAAGARSTVLRKQRSGDYSVSIDDEGLGQLGSGTPVLVDDIASSARTLIEAVGLINKHGGRTPICAVVHAVFAGDSYERLLGSGVTTVVSTNTVAHDSNTIDISEPISTAVRSVLAHQTTSIVMDPPSRR